MLVDQTAVGNYEDHVGDDVQDDSKQDHSETGTAHSVDRVFGHQHHRSDNLQVPEDHSANSDHVDLIVNLASFLITISPPLIAYFLTGIDPQSQQQQHYHYSSNRHWDVGVGLADGLAGVVGGGVGAGGAGGEALAGMEVEGGGAGGTGGLTAQTGTATGGTTGEFA